jgi:hypothetical protein
MEWKFYKDPKKIFIKIGKLNIYKLLKLVN